MLVGWDLGAKGDAMYTHLDVHAYSSLSVGAQLRCHTSEKHALYIEPRYTIDDNLVSVTAGLEYAMTEQRFRSGRLAKFEPYYNMGLAGGVTHRFQTTLVEGMPQLGATVGLSGEYHFNPYSGARLTLDYAEATNGSTMRASHINTGVDYMFDLSTLFAGYTPERRLDVSLAVGPVFGMKAAFGNEYVKHNVNSSMGMQAGIPVLFHLTEKFGLSLEPRAQAFFNPSYAGVNNGRSAIINLQMGMKYTF